MDKLDLQVPPAFYVGALGSRGSIVAGRNGVELTRKRPLHALTDAEMPSAS